MNTDPLDELRAANPVADHDLPSASLARIRARVSEDVMTTPTNPGRRVPTALRAGLGIAAAAAVAVAVLVGTGSGAPGGAPGPSADGGTAMCVEPYASPASVANRDLAFDGTVTAINGDDVTFTVNDAYRGAADATVTLKAAGMTGTAITSAGGPSLRVGERYLVAGDGSFVWACGYTQAYDADLAAQWATATGG